MAITNFCVTFCVAYFFLNIHSIDGVAVEESASGAILSFPELIDGDLFNVTWEVEPAAFGYADYGGTLEAFLVLPMNRSYHTECDAEEDTENPYIHLINDYEGSDALWILVIDRGDCYFATKVWNAEQMGAAGVIMLDNKQEDLFPMWEPDNFEHDITIPSVELQMNYAKLLMKHLNVKQWDPFDTSNTTYPNAVVCFATENEVATCNGSEHSYVITKALIEWGLPHEDDRVEWELWTSANDDRTLEFKKNFKSTSITLDAANDTVFTPHYYILNGSHWNCDSSHLRCGNQCTNSGRYCAVDPEYDLNHGIAGMDVVQENMRQLCVWNFTTHGDKTIHNESVWWDYSILWNDKCFNNTNDETTFNEDCSKRQMLELENRGVTGLSDYVDHCINATGGYCYHCGENSLMDYEVRFREDLSVYILPSFRVNEFMIYGEVDCDIVTEDGCSVLDSICSGFLDGTQPDLCYATPAPTPRNCSASQRDCAGICFGESETDRCGDCKSPTSSSWNSCVGCDNVTNSGMKTNPCGYCYNKDNSDWSTYGQGCDGVCNSHYDTDDCGICRSVYSSEWNGCVGCDGVVRSGKEWNPCGKCIVNTTSNFDTYGMDCNGTCDGSAETDRCGQCLLPSSPEWNGCVPSTTAYIIYEPGVSNNNETKSLSAAIVAIGVIAFIVILIAGIVIYKLYKKQQQQSKQFENILKTYTLMDENPGQAPDGLATGGSPQATDGTKKSRNPLKRKKGMPVPTEDVDEDNNTAL